MSFESEIDAAQHAMAEADYDLAYRAFGRAHDLGHARKRDHLAAHRGMVRAAWKGKRLDRAAKNCLLMGAAFLFDRRGPQAAT